MTFSLSSLYLILACLEIVSGQANAGWNQVLNLNGNMALNSFTFPDNSKIETYSQKQQQMIVNQNTSPLTANHVVGSTGQPFVQLSQNSMTIQTNNATDLVGAQIELAIDPAVLQQNNISSDNTFVAMLSPGRQAWVVMEGIKSVNTTDNTVRIVKMTNIDGEYMAIGRQSTETSNVLTPFGSKSVNISGSGIQEVEFADGFRMSMKATQPMTLRTDVVNGVSTSMITTQGMMPVNNYRYLVTTNLAAVAPNLNSMVSVVQLPLNVQRVMAMAQSMGIGANEAVVIGVAQRTVLQNPGGATGNLSPNRARRVRRAAKSSKSTSTEPAASEATVDATMESPTESAETAPADAASSSAAETATPTDATSSMGDGGATTTPASDQSTNNQPPSNTNPQSPAATQLLLSPTFTPITAPTQVDPTTGRVMVAVSQINGEFILTMQRSTSQGTQGAEGAQGTQGTQGAEGAQGTQGAPGAEGTQGAQGTQGAEGGNAAGQVPQEGAPRSQPAGQAGATISMASLATLLQKQKMGGVFAAAEMMQQFMQTQGAGVLL